MGMILNYGINLHKKGRSMLRRLLAGFLQSCLALGAGFLLGRFWIHEAHVWPEPGLVRQGQIWLMIFCLCLVFVKFIRVETMGMALMAIPFFLLPPEFGRRGFLANILPAWAVWLSISYIYYSGGRRPHQAFWTSILLLQPFFYFEATQAIFVGVTPLLGLSSPVVLTGLGGIATFYLIYHRREKLRSFSVAGVLALFFLFVNYRIIPSRGGELLLWAGLFVVALVLLRRSIPQTAFFGLFVILLLMFFDIPAHKRAYAVLLTLLLKQSMSFFYRMKNHRYIPLAHYGLGIVIVGFYSMDWQIDRLDLILPSFLFPIIARHSIFNTVISAISIACLGWWVKRVVERTFGAFNLIQLRALVTGKLLLLLGSVAAYWFYFGLNEKTSASINHCLVLAVLVAPVLVWSR